MPNRRSLQLRRDDATVPLRDSATFDSALRSDFSYIPQELIDARTKLLVETIDHTSVRVSYDPLAVPVDTLFGSYVEVAVLRSPAGYPQTNMDGYVLSRRTVADNATVEGWVTFVDRDLSPGRWSYYSLFVKYVSGGNTHWLRLGEASVLLPAEHKYADRLWQMYPEWYRQSDGDGIGASDVLRRLTNAIGFETDLHRTWVEQVGQVWDIDNASARILDEIGDALGQPYEEAAGMRRYRSLLSSLLFLRKRKGTADGVGGFLTALTGYRTIVYPGPNKLLTADDSRGLYTAGRWAAINANATVGRAVAGANLANGPQIGDTYLRATSSNATSQTLGLSLSTAASTDVATMVPVPPGGTIKVALTAWTSAAAGDGTLRLDFRTKAGGVVSNSSQVLTGLDATAKRYVKQFTVPATANFAVVTVSKDAAVAAAGVTLNVWRVMLVDNAWRPEAVPGTATTAPLANNHPGYYDDVNYYEDPRQVWINVYPQRVNLALNSNFTLNNLPAGAWVAADEPTYSLLESAYSSYDDIIDAEPGDSEASYDDLASGFAPTGAAWTLAFDTANKRLNVTSALRSGRYYTQVSTHLYPVHSLIGMSAAIVASSTVANTTTRMRMRWYTANDTGTVIKNPDGTHLESVSESFVVGTARQRVVLANATPPANATYGRMVLETDAAAAHVVRYEQALIENAASPGPYFDGNVTEGELGDFFFTGTGGAYTNPSAYYMGYRSFISGPGGADRLASIMAELLPPGVGYKFLSASNGLY